ncbi:zinc-binding alcohol dehydrogenase [Microbacterium sp. M3]|uniref:Zinc-binding alcohol dehydrogenase n=1 Tax=Microbacterium arthrosphaerae TaxID=792652 RepID=A0ABU4GXC1_9MICO|nr:MULTISPECIES: zinc-binding alcohol dehydrogenase [Microbacterium]MDW4571728.1 zinc-binding alcohol dehydrogenase [Microbacterium arthrosphaerae]MDW7605583.1 zinc-binding alcohol dehydrogenase [Microbacterium sp. M3]
MADTRNTTQAPVAVHLEDPDAATAWWTTGPGKGQFRSEPLPTPSAAEAAVRTLWTGISRGTESLVARGAVPESERERMRAPFQAGDFPFPVKYGYLNVGVVENGPSALRGRTVFALVPHQSRYVAPADALAVVPDDVPARRAVLAGAVETAVNVLWDAAPVVGDRVLVVGAGIVGGAIARLARGIPGAEVTLVDVDPGKAATAHALGVAFAEAEDLGDADLVADVVIEASGTGAGLQRALRAAPTDGEVVVASWYGSDAVPLELGADFHSRRIAIRSSQVGAVSVRRRAQRSTRDRLALALRLLADPAFDALLGGATPWRALPEITAALAAGSAGVLCQTIDWSAE